MIEQLKQETRWWRQADPPSLEGPPGQACVYGPGRRPRILQPLVQEAVRQQVPLEQVSTMKALGEACGIAVGAAIAALV